VITVTAGGCFSCGGREEDRADVPARHQVWKNVPVSPWLYGTWREDGERAAKAMGEKLRPDDEGAWANVTGRTIQEACSTRFTGADSGR